MLLIILELNYSTSRLVSKTKNVEDDICVLIEKKQMINQVRTLGYLKNNFTWESGRGRKIFSEKDILSSWLSQIIWFFLFHS